MAQSPISLQPQSQDLKLYGGDGVALRLLVTNTLGVAIDLTGEILAEIRQSRVNPSVAATFAADLTDAADGIAVITLAGVDTAALHGDTTPVERFTGVWDVQWTPQGDEPVTIIQGNVESLLDVSRD